LFYSSDDEELVGHDRAVIHDGIIRGISREDRPVKVDRRKSGCFGVE
jgi:hypothetical protein